MNNEATVEEKYGVRLPKQIQQMLNHDKGEEGPVAEETIEKAPAAAVKPTVEAVVEAMVEEPDGNYEQAYKTLKGKYDAEVPALQRRVRELEADLEMRTPVGATAAPGDLQEELTDEELEDADQETLAVVKKMIQQANGVSKAELGQLRREAFKARLAVICPDCVAINKNPEFLAWLDKPQPLAGKDRWDLLKEADAANDAERVAEFFLAWKQEQGGRVLNGGGLKNNVVPETHPVGGAAEPAKGKIKTSVISQFYLDVTKGRYQNNPEVKRRLDAEYKLAIAENRLIDDMK